MTINSKLGNLIGERQENDYPRSVNQDGEHCATKMTIAPEYSWENSVLSRTENKL